MSNNLEVVRAYLEAAWKDVPVSLAEAADIYLADSFQSFDAAGHPQMNKEAYVGAGQMMALALEDFRWVLSDLRQEGDDVLMTGHFEGRHTSDLDLSALGAGVIPASGRMIVWPDANLKWVVQDRKIVREESLDESGGMETFLAALMA